MLSVGWNGDMLQPVLPLCPACRLPVSVVRDWLGFPALDPGQSPVEGKFIHRACVDGNAARVFGCEHITLWRGRDVLAKLLSLSE
jgi:hypothetical protein